MSEQKHLINLKPPAPKFDPQLIFKSNTSDSEETKIVTNIKSEKRRIKHVLQELRSQMQFLSSHFKNIEKIEEMATMFIQSDCLKSLRAKRYQSIASAAIIHSFRHNHIPITLKEYQELFNLQEKQIKKILNILLVNFPLNNDKEIEVNLKSISTQLGLSEKFVNVCLQIKNFLNEKQLIDGEHSKVVSGSIIKMAGDLIFEQRGGINLQVLTQRAKCCDVSVKSFLKKIEGNQQELYKYLAQKFS